MKLKTIIDLVLHLDRHLNELVTQVGPEWFYLLLFLVIFCETGLVITPFLPGDSLLFAVGALCASEQSALNIWIMLPLLLLAAIVGDAVNYWMGAIVGPRVFQSDTSRWLNKDHLLHAQSFYEKYGAKTIILARFMPIIRTFAPFVAGIGKMNFAKFWFYNIVGGTIWVTGFMTAGYWFGSWSIVKDNFLFVTLGIIFVSLLPIVFEWRKATSAKKETR